MLTACSTPGPTRVPSLVGGRLTVGDPVNVPGAAARVAARRDRGGEGVGLGPAGARETGVRGAVAGPPHKREAVGPGLRPPAVTTSRWLEAPPGA